MNSTQNAEEQLVEALRAWNSYSFLVKTYSGHVEEDAKAWLRHIDRQCDRYRIPVEQRIEAAFFFMRGEVVNIFRDSLRQIQEEVQGYTLTWDEFKEALIYSEVRKREQSQPNLEFSASAAPERSKDNKLLARLAGGGLVAGGSSVLLPSAGIAALNAVGFTSSGVAAGSLAAGIQSVVYGGATGGIFSVMQSIGATAVVAPPVAIGLGAGAVAVGVGCLVASHIKKSRKNEDEGKEKSS